ncbi:MAG TPA: hypothetical protein VF459_11485 [Caulobacteraceae bacterium]
MVNENEPLVPPVQGEIMQKSWTSSHLEAAMNQQAPAPAPAQSAPAPAPAPTPAPPAQD